MIKRKRYREYYLLIGSPIRGGASGASRSSEQDGALGTDDWIRDERLGRMISDITG